MDTKYNIFIAVLGVISIIIILILIFSPSPSPVIPPMLPPIPYIAPNEIVNVSDVPTPPVSSLPAKIFKWFTNSYTVGGIGGDPYDFTCNENTYVTDINTRSGDTINAITMKCSDGKTLTVGGTGGNPYTMSQPNGFRKLDTTTGDAVNTMNWYGPDNAQLGIKYGTVTGPYPSTLDCGADGKVMGMMGNADTTVNSIGIKCGKYV